MTNTNTTTTPPPASPQPPKRKSWPRRHPIIATAIGVFTGIVAVIIAVSALAASVPTGTGVGSTPTHSAPANPTPNADNNAPLPPGYDGTNGGAPASPPAPAGPAALAVGDTLPVTQNGQDAGTVTVKSVQVTTAPADTEFGSAPANGYFLIVTVTASSKIAGFDINDLDFYAMTHHTHYDEGDGNSYDAVSNSPDGVTTTLNAGESTTGQILFDVSAPHGKIVYAPNYGEAPLAAWKF